MSEEDPAIELTLEQKVDQLTEGVQWLLTAVHHIGQTTDQTAQAFNMIYQGILASPMGGAIRKQLESVQRG